MKLQQASRKRTKIRMLLQGTSGSGKTMSALKIAQGLSEGDWKKIAIIDTEHQSADLYSNLGDYNVVHLKAPFTPESYLEAIEICEKAGMEVIILDSISHSWEYLLDYHASLPGNSFTNWSKVTPRQNVFIDRILRSSAHIIATVRSKSEYTMVEKNGKQIPEKVGLKGIQRDGVEYEYSICLELDIKHFASASKDRTGLFADQTPFRITKETGELIKNWCQEGVDNLLQEVKKRIGECSSIQDLASLYHQFPEYQQVLRQDFENQKRKLQVNMNLKTEATNQNLILNGQHHD